MIRTCTTAVLTFSLFLTLLFTGCGSDSSPSQPTVRKSAVTDGVMQSRRQEYMMVPLLDGRVLLAGGYDTGDAAPLDNAELFASTTKTFTITANSMSSARYQAAAVRLSDGRVLITGGQDDQNVLYTADMFDPATNRFTPTGPMQVARIMHTATLLPDGRVLITGGKSHEGAVVSSAEIFDPQTGRCTLLKNKPLYSRAGHAAVLLKNGKVLIAGGISGLGDLSRGGELFDPGTEKFTQTKDFSGGGRLKPTATLLNNGKVLVAGGGTGLNFVTHDNAELYDPESNSFTATGTRMYTGRIGHAAVMLANGKVLLAGGFFYENMQSALGTAELYDPVSNTFSLTGSLNFVRGGISGALLANGSVLIAGGRDTIEYSRASAELYDPVSAAFTVSGGMNRERVLDGSLLLNDGSVLISGGLDTLGTPLKSAERYIPATGRFVPISGGMHTPRYGHTPVILKNGAVLLAGGSTDRAELYDPTENRFTPLAAAMNSSRRNHTATLLQDGNVLLAGGEDADSKATTTAELFLPASSTFVPVGSLSVARTLHTAHLMPDGRVLLIGGTSSMNNYTQNALASAELYNPATRTFTAVASQMSAARVSHASHILRNGAVLISGGRNGDGLLSTTELFDLSTLTFRPVANMPLPLSGHRMVLLADGTAALIGGTTYYETEFGRYYTSSSRTLLYNPTSDSFAAGPSLQSERDSCLALGLPDGSVLISGGGFFPKGHKRVVLETAELLLP